jgi:hypothetical protein
MQAAQAPSTAPERSVAALTAAGFGALTLWALSLLHGLSPEFHPSWRMVSEYANGRHGGLLAAMFVSWALSSWLLAYALYPLAATWPAKLGVLNPRAWPAIDHDQGDCRAARRQAWADRQPRRWRSCPAAARAP